MSLQYIIDSYNIINHPQFRSKAKQSKSIQQTLHDFILFNKLTGSSKNTVVLVFDGYPAIDCEIPEEKGYIWIYSRKIEADEKIKEIVEQAVQPRNIVVVSDDRQIQLTARLLHANICSVEEFICGKKNGKLSVGKEVNSDNIELTYAVKQKINAEFKKKWLE